MSDLSFQGNNQDGKYEIFFFLKKKRYSLIVELTGEYNIILSFNDSSTHNVYRFPTIACS